MGTDRYRRLFDDSTAPQLVVDGRDGRIVEANRAAADFYGVTPDGLTGTTLSSLGVEDPGGLRDALEVAAAVGVHLVGLAQRHASGEVRRTEVYGTPFAGPDQQLVHLILHDITEREAARDREREFLGQLARQDALQRTETFSRMGELVSGVAHEVRNPLFALSSAIDALRQRLADNEHFARYAPLLTSQVERLSTLMADLLDYGRPAALAVRPVRVTEVLVATAEVCSPIGERARVAVEPHSSCRPETWVAVDLFRFVQALQNLVTNAIQHAPAGSTVTLEAHMVDADVEFSVIDQGPGFDEASIASVFEPFYSRRPGGTGLGLALVHRTVHDHQGTVSAENQRSSDGRVVGAVVRVRLPTTSSRPK
ncbi:MAG: PAS domain-containing protein [Gemmatimonadaceae bacterium]|nr:PAS domain-containing protein [Gemmatimonadaceae bacterium]